MGYLRFRFSNIRFKLFILGFSLLYQKFFFFFFFLRQYIFYTKLQASNCLVFLCLIDKEQVAPRLSLINVPALNYQLRSQIFVNDNGQLRAAHLVLDYKPLSRSFQDVSNAIKANDYRLARIDVSRPRFLAPHDQGVEAIVISEAKEETDEYSCIQTPAPIITYVEDSSDNEAEEMAPKSGQSLRELMKGRNKVSTPPEANKSKPSVNPPPPLSRLPADLGLKPNPELRRKRQHKAPEEGEIGPSKGNKQQRVSKDQRSKRSSSVESREDHHTPRTWFPKLEVDGVPIAWDTSIRNYQREGRSCC